jgi:hypothetical protein
MRTFYVGNTLINDVFLGSQRMDDVFTPPAAYTIEYLIVAGGGGSGGSQNGGGGAGGLLSGSLLLRSQTIHNGFVGDGGAAYNGITFQQNGQNSFFSASYVSLVSIGGGSDGGCTSALNPNLATGSNGGSGGGGGVDCNGVANNGGSGVSGQGFAGGNATFNTFGGGGGGGGASQAGTNSPSRNGGNGGNGLQSAIRGTLVYYAGGGAGNKGVGSPTGITGSAGLGGGGAVDANGTPNTGGGAGGGGNRIGGSGIIVIRYEGTQKGIGGDVTTDGNFTIHSFTSSGAFTYYS